MTLARIVFCEGFDDRGFLDGALRRLGCVEPKGSREPGFEDALGRVRPHFSYATPRGHTLRLAQTGGGGDPLRRQARAFLKRHSSGLERVLILQDADTMPGDPLPPHTVLPRLRERIALEGVDAREALFHAPVAAASDLPDKQTLERVVCCAIERAHPGRTSDVSTWLGLEPSGGSTHKNHAHAHFAKWYAHRHGSESFFRMVWEDDVIVPELEGVLEDAGLWSLLQWIAE